MIYGKGVFTLYFKVLFMSEQNQHLETLNDIRQIMERSSKFISLSGWSGIAAGICALTGAWFAYGIITETYGPVGRISVLNEDRAGKGLFDLNAFMGSKLFLIALATFFAAFILAFIFTYYRSLKTKIPIWGPVARRLMINVMIPMIAGGIFLLRMIQLGIYGLIAPGCLIFYGLALVNASKYTLGEIRWLGYGQIVLGLVNCWWIGYGLYFWAIGFGVLHIVYGILMWWKYERAG